MIRSRGFTLVELMIAVAVIAVLAGIALPAYETYKVRASRGAAQAFLLEVFSRQEEYAIRARAYAFCATDPCTGPELTGVMNALGLEVPTEVASQYNVNVRRIVVAAVAGVTSTAFDGYEARATPKVGSRQAGANDGILAITQFGLRTVRNTDNSVRTYW